MTESKSQSNKYGLTPTKNFASNVILAKNFNLTPVHKIESIDSARFREDFGD